MRTDLINAKKFLDMNDFASRSKGISIIRYIYDAEAVLVLKTYRLIMKDPGLDQLCSEAIEHIEKNLNARAKVISEVKESSLANPINENTPKWLEFCEKIVPLIVELEIEKKTFVKSDIVKQIGNFRNDCAIPVLVKHLEDSDSRLKANTIEALVMIGCDPVLSRIIPLLWDTNARVRANASQAVWKFSADRVYLVLREMLTGQDTSIQRSAIFAINTIREPESIELLRSVLDQLQGYEQNYARQIIRNFEREEMKKKLRSPAVILGSLSFLAACLLMLFSLHHFSWDQRVDREMGGVGRMRKERAMMKTADGRGAMISVPAEYLFIKDASPSVIRTYARVSTTYIQEIDRRYSEHSFDQENDSFHASKNSRIQYARFLVRNKAWSEAELLYHQILSDHPENEYIALEVISDLYNLYKITGETEKIEPLDVLLTKLVKVKFPTLINGKDMSLDEIESHMKEFSKGMVDYAQFCMENSALKKKK